MDKIQLSAYYLMSVSRIQRHAIDLYEKLHDEKGDPIHDEELVRKACTELLVDSRKELDFLKDALEERNSQ